VAAYNTGTGNVAKAFNIDKSRNIKKAARLINKLTPDQVYAHLIENLPYDETKHYLKRVIKRQKIYDVLDTI
jgi:membrane-bound lytic murein transglycosylase C